MNDFTKEELQLILKGMSQYYLEKNSLELMDRIQSMIDNYCDHDKCPNPECNLNRHPSNVGCIKINE